MHVRLICVVRKNIRKFMEALMAGCVPASDLPFEMEEILRDVVIKLDAKMTTKEIGIVIEKELNDDKGLQIKAAEGIILAREYFSCQAKGDRALRLMDDFNKGYRGYILPHGVRLGCHSYMAGFENVNPWCKQRSKK